ncbi:MAG: helix-turn-helix domain-containing protein [Phycisphaerales bacterium]
MARPIKPKPEASIGTMLRAQRVEKLDKGLREMARLLDITAAHLTDIELGRRTPSEDLLVKIAAAYRLPEADLRAGWNRPDAVVGEVASQNPANAEKVPEFLRTARDFPPQLWDRYIEQAKADADALKRAPKRKP